MPAKGTYAALKQLTKNDTDFGAQQREQDRLSFAKEREQNRKDEAAAKVKREEQDAFEADLQSLEYNIINNESIDDAGIRHTQRAMDELSKMEQEAKANPKLRGDVNWMSKRSSILNMPKYLKAASNAYAKQSETLAERHSKGTLSAWNSKDVYMASSLYADANLEYTLDPETGKTRAYTTVPDPFGPTGHKVIELGLDKALDGRGINEFIDKIEWSEENKDRGTSLGKNEQIQKLPGFETRITSGWDEKGANGELSIKDREKILAEARFGRMRGPDPDGDGPKEGKIYDSWTNAAKSYWTDKMGNERPEDGKITEEEMTQLIDDYVSDIGQYYDNTIKSSTNRPRSINVNIDKGGGSTIITDETEEGVPILEPLNESGTKEGFAVSPSGGLPAVVGITKDNIKSVGNIFVTKDREVYADVITQKVPEGVDISGMNLIDAAMELKKKGKSWESSKERRKLSPIEVGNVVKNKGYAKPDKTVHKNTSEAINYWTEEFTNLGGSFKKKTKIEFN